MNKPLVNFAELPATLLIMHGSLLSRWKQPLPGKDWKGPFVIPLRYPLCC